MLAVLLLVATVVLAMVGREAWRPVFGLAHLAAVAALVPLGLALVARAFREAREQGTPGVIGVVRRHAAIAAVLAVVVVTVTISLATFEDGPRWLRRTANLTTVALVLVLVARYLWWARRERV